jgi:hypothetical protein
METFLPSESMRYNPTAPSRSLSNAIRDPSGDHTGCQSWAGSFVSLVTCDRGSHHIDLWIAVPIAREGDHRSIR